MLKGLGLLLAAAMGSALVACGPDCVSMCEKAQEDGECFVIHESGRDVDCESYCEDLESVLHWDECLEDLDEMVACMDEAENACHALSESCAEEHYDVFSCTVFCEDGNSEDREDCRAVLPVHMDEH